MSTTSPTVAGMRCTTGTSTSTDLSAVSDSSASGSSPGSAAPTSPGRIRNTRQAGVIEAALRSADGFRTAQQLFARLREQGERIGLTTIYRYLNLLAEHGRADVVRAADGEAQYRLCGPADIAGSQTTPAHHHHVVCRVCGRSVQVRGPEVEVWAEQVAADAGYTDVSHTLEVFGLCPQHSSHPKTSGAGPAARRTTAG